MTDSKIRIKYLRDSRGNVRAAIGTEIVSEGVINAAACVVSDQDEFCKKTARSILKNRLQNASDNGIYTCRPFKKYNSRFENADNGHNNAVSILKAVDIGMINGGVDLQEYKEKIIEASKRMLQVWTNA